MGIRKSWREYGITKARYRELRGYCERPENRETVEAVAYEVSAFVAKHIVESVTQRKTFELIEFSEKNGRVMCGRSDFYGYRRKFYALLDEKLKENK